ncbi:hypothetical protein Tco_0740213 [Tanacetum coccineum]
MVPKNRTTRLNPETITTTLATTSITNAQLQAMIDQDVTAALWSIVMLLKFEMAKTAIIQERVLEEMSEPLVSVLTQTS